MWHNSLIPGVFKSFIAVSRIIKSIDNMLTFFRYVSLFIYIQLIWFCDIDIDVEALNIYINLL